MSSRTPVFHSLNVREKRHHTDDSTVITFEVPADLADVYTFVAGQHLSLRAEFDGREVRRSYSVCAPAGGPLQIGVRRIPDGAMSTWLNDVVAVGDSIDVMTPLGSFTCPPAHNGGPRHHVAIAAGSGITPVLSIVATVLETEPTSSVTLLYLNRRPSSSMFTETLEGLKNRYLHRLRLTHLFSREPGWSDLLSGRLDADRFDAVVRAGVVPIEADTYFVCGPQPLSDTVVAGLASAGVDGHRVHTELFGVPASARPEAPDGTGASGAECNAMLNGRVTTVSVEPGQTVLDAIRARRPDVPYSCTVGACSTCRARVTSGAVDMQVCYGLEPEEVEAGYVLTCQARPTTDEVAVDYDI